MDTLRMRRRLCAALLCLLCVILAACGGASSTSSNMYNLSNNGQAASSSQQGALNALQQHAGSMPTTQTSCPLPLLTGRVPVMQPLDAGTDPALVYINNYGTSPAPTSYGELKLYDTAYNGDNAGSKTIAGTSLLLHEAGALITEAQISANGQWILFVSLTQTGSQIQLLRVDGRGLQTLYCAPPGTVQSLQWSPDGGRFLFSQASISGLLNLYLFNMSTGSVQAELVQKNDAALGYEARTWFDNQRAYITGIPNPAAPGAAPRGLFALDTSKGPDQSPADLSQLISPAQDLACRSFDSDYDSTVLVTSQCQPGSSQFMGSTPLLTGPSTIQSQGILGGPAHLLYRSPSQAITQVRLLGYSSNALLLTFNYLRAPNDSQISSTPVNGLWRINTDGTGLTTLAAIPTYSSCSLNEFTQYPWSNVSRDNRYFALAISEVGSKSREISLEIGSLAQPQGSLVTFEEASGNVGTLAVAGWVNL